jgi:hypothetical protein
MILVAEVALQQYWRLVVAGNQNIDHAIVIKVAYREASCRQRPRKYWTAYRAYISQPAAGVVKQENDGNLDLIIANANPDVLM